MRPVVLSLWQEIGLLGSVRLKDGFLIRLSEGPVILAWR
jgi:hypothetical protein